MNLPQAIRLAITAAVTDVTKRWSKQRKAEERSANAWLRRDQVMDRKRNISIKAAAWDGMEAAYLKASGNGKFPANARQVYYAARPRILELTGKQVLDDNYFIQKLVDPLHRSKGCRLGCGL